jgi:hypothetical protein
VRIYGGGAKKDKCREFETGWRLGFDVFQGGDDNGDAILNDAKGMVR